MTTKTEYRTALTAWKKARDGHGRSANDRALYAAERTCNPGVIALARQAYGLDDDPTGTAIHTLIDILTALSR